MSAVAALRCSCESETSFENRAEDRGDEDSRCPISHRARHGALYARTLRQSARPETRLAPGLTHEFCGRTRKDDGYALVV